MDMETMNRLEQEADERDQTAAILEHWKRKADRRRFLAFCFNWRQVVDDPAVTVATPGVLVAPTPRTLGGASGAAGLRGEPSATAGPTHGNRLPGGPHLPAPLATRISAGITWQ